MLKYYLVYNSRLDEAQAAFLLVKLAYLDQWNEARRKIALAYSEQLNDCPHLHLPKVHPKAQSVHHIYNIRAERRDELQVHLKGLGIGTMVHYPLPPHLQKAYAGLGYSKGDFPLAEELALTSLSLPIYPGLGLDQVALVMEGILGFL